MGAGAVNAAGLDFYDRLIDLLLANGIEPLVDVYHWELPEALARQGGFLNDAIVGHFERYARLCFQRYGDRVKLWSTMNEPSACGFVGDDPVYQPVSQRLKANGNILAMHFAAVRAFRQMKLPGKIGAVIPVVPMYTRSLSQADQAAAVRQGDYVHNIWLDPILRGAYPSSLLGRPEITEHVDQAYVDAIARHYEPVDFIGLNYYNPCVVGYVKGCLLDAEPARPFEAQSDYGFSIYPQGIFDTIMDIHRRYNGPEIYITENASGGIPPFVPKPRCLMIPTVSITSANTCARWPAPSLPEPMSRGTITGPISTRLSAAADTVLFRLESYRPENQAAYADSRVVLLSKRYCCGDCRLNPALPLTVD